VEYWELPSIGRLSQMRFGIIRVTLRHPSPVQRPKHFLCQSIWGVERHGNCLESGVESAAFVRIAFQMINHWKWAQEVAGSRNIS
jgi:hypothetical protein